MDEVMGQAEVEVLTCAIVSARKVLLAWEASRDPAAIVDVALKLSASRRNRSEIVVALVAERNAIANYALDVCDPGHPPADDELHAALLVDGGELSEHERLGEQRGGVSVSG
jgi:hypothetical protein